MTSRPPLERPRVLAASERTPTVDVITRAFHDDPLSVWLEPDPLRQDVRLRHFWDFTCRCALRDGLAQGIGTPARGSALWLTPGAPYTSAYAAIAGGFVGTLAGLGPSAAARCLRFAFAIENVRREAVPGPHWYLMVLAVAPEHQGRGLGGALLRPTLEAARSQGVPCYLETTKPTNVILYQRLGFRLLGEHTLGSRWGSGSEKGTGLRFFFDGDVRMEHSWGPRGERRVRLQHPRETCVR